MADLKEKRGAWKLKEEALDYSVWGTGFGKGYGNFRMADCEMKEWYMVKMTTYADFQ